MAASFAGWPKLSGLALPSLPGSHPGLYEPLAASTSSLSQVPEHLSPPLPSLYIFLLDRMPPISVLGPLLSGQNGPSTASQLNKLMGGYLNQQQQPRVLRTQLSPPDTKISGLLPWTNPPLHLDLPPLLYNFS